MASAEAHCHNCAATTGCNTASTEIDGVATTGGIWVEQSATPTDLTCTETGFKGVTAATCTSSGWAELGTCADGGQLGAGWCGGGTRDFYMELKP